MPVEMQAAVEPGVLVLTRKTVGPADLASSVRQQPIPKGKYPGLLTETFILPRSGEKLSKQTFDSVFRPAMAELGYAVLDSDLELKPIRLQWRKEAGAVGEPDVWDLWVVDGPARVLGAVYAHATIDPVHSQELRLLEASTYVAVYRVLVRPHDGVFNDEKMKAASRKQAQGLEALGLGKISLQASNHFRAQNLHTVLPVAPPGGALLWLSLIGLGAVGVVSAVKNKR